jgi:Leucine-rich repeat (LRR) protein
MNVGMQFSSMLHSSLGSPRLTNLRTLDVSKNNLKSLGAVNQLTQLKSLNCQSNQLTSLRSISSLEMLQNLTAGKNSLGLNEEDGISGPLPSLPSSLKQLILDQNSFLWIPRSVVAKNLTKLEKLDLSNNRLEVVPDEIKNLIRLEELRLDRNNIAFLPSSMGNLVNLKALSLSYNKLTGPSSNSWSERHPQPIPPALLTDTALIDLTLTGNALTSTQLNQSFEGFDAFLERRAKVKTKDLYGGAMANYSVCGLD